MTRLNIPRRKPGTVAKARPSPGCPAKQMEKARQISFERYENAYRELAKV